MTAQQLQQNIDFLSSQAVAPNFFLLLQRALHLPILLANYVSHKVILPFMLFSEFFPDYFTATIRKNFHLMQIQNAC